MGAERLIQLWKKLLDRISSFSLEKKLRLIRSIDCQVRCLLLVFCHDTSHHVVLYTSATTLEPLESVDHVEAKISNQDIEINSEVPAQFTALDSTVESSVPRVAPLPKVRSPVRSPRKPASDPVSPGTNSLATTTSRKKSNLPRVATLAQSSPKSRVEPKKSPPPFRAGGRVGPGWNRDGTGTASRKVTPTRRASSSSMTTRETNKELNSSLGSRSSTTESITLPRRTSSPRAGSRRTIVKPPENIKRAIKESRELSKRDSLDSDDSDMQNLQEILNDIKTIKSELGVESSKAEEEEVVESVLRPKSPVADGPEVAEIEAIQSEDITVSYMTDIPAELDPDEAEGPRCEPEKVPAHVEETTTEQDEEDKETKQPPTDAEARKESSSCACCSIM